MPGQKTINRLTNETNYNQKCEHVTQAVRTSPPSEMILRSSYAFFCFFLLNWVAPSSASEWCGAGYNFEQQREKRRRICTKVEYFSGDGLKFAVEGFFLLLLSASPALLLPLSGWGGPYLAHVGRLVEEIDQHHPTTMLLITILLPQH
jgi:hypothetical protein